METEALTVHDFCKQYRIGRDKFYNEVRSRRLRALKVGKKTLILKRDAEAWVESLPSLELAATA
jgi:excisionase family DNA binding protein